MAATMDEAIAKMGAASEFCMFNAAFNATRKVNPPSGTRATSRLGNQLCWEAVTREAGR